MSKYGTGTCRGCGKRRSIKKNGGLYYHEVRATDGVDVWWRCPGSGQEPTEHLRLGRDYQVMDVLRIEAKRRGTDCQCTHSREEHNTPGQSCTRCVWCDQFKAVTDA